MNKTIKVIIFLCLIALFSAACVSPLNSFRRNGQTTKPPLIIFKKDPNSLYDKLSGQSLEALQNGDFAWLEESADKARREKERLPGGYWKLHGIYKGVSTPDSERQLTDAEWQEHIKKVETWKNKFPQSITARIALGETWRSFAWDARGTGYVNTVPPANWKLFRERIAAAEKELLEAKKLDRFCPQWYVSMLEIAKVSDWDRENFEQIFEAGFALEPTYYYLHRAKGTYLLPRWQGREGEWTKFTEEISARVGGDEGKMIYFIMVGNMQEAYGSEIFRKNDVSWEKAKEGFAAMNKICGADNYRLNQYAVLAFYAEDMQTAQTAFEKIGDNWDEQTWRSKRLFDEAKFFAAKYNASKPAAISKESNPQSHKKTIQNP